MYIVYLHSANVVLSWPIKDTHHGIQYAHMVWTPLPMGYAHCSYGVSYRGRVCVYRLFTLQDRYALCIAGVSHREGVDAYGCMRHTR